MTFVKKNKIFLIILVFTLCLLIASRFVLLDKSARFVWDESDDMVRMSQMYHRNPITLIGPMNANKTFLQSSLTYYMLLPGAIIMNFNPMGPVYMTALYGCLLVIMFAWILKRFFGWNLPVAIIFLTFLFPFVQTSRWAWNPHYIPFWQTAALLLFLLFEKQRTHWGWILVGFFFALTFHNHWYAFFSVAGFSAGVFFYLISQKRIKDFIAYCIGVLGTILPLLVFDLMHPPGLFITRALFFSPISPKNGAFNLASIPMKLLSFPVEFMMYFLQNRVLAVLFLLTTIIYIFFVFRQKTTSKFKKIILLPVVAQIVGLTFIGGSVFDYYYLGAVVPFILFLSIPDKTTKVNLLRLILLICLFIFSLLPSIGEIRKDTWMTNIGRKMTIYQIIKDNLPNNKKCNVFVPASESGDAVGKIYRDLLIARDDIWLYSQEEYGNYPCLFVVSTSGVARIQKDPAYELDRIRKITPIKRWSVGNTDWKIYYFEIKDKKQQ